MQRQKLIIRTSLIGILANVVLVIAKIITGLFAHSLAIILEAVNNLTDVLSSVLTIVGTKLAGREPDREHPYGHGRIEYITTMLVGLIILSSGIIAIYEAIKKILAPEEISYGISSLIIMVLAIGAKILIGTHYRKIAKKTQSDTLDASGKDALFDAILSSATVIGIIVNLSTGFNPEGILSILIAIFIIKTGIEILRESWRDLIGRRTNSELSVAIKKRILKFKEVSGAYDLFLHNYGPSQVMGSAHIQIPDNMTASQIDALSRKITEAIYKDFRVLLTVGIYAENSSSEEHREIRKKIDIVLDKYPEAKQMHGFYVDTGHKHITFDVIFDFDFPHKVAMRNIRRDADKSFKKLTKEDVSEDVVKDLQDELQKLTDRHIKEVDEAVAKKIDEVMTV